jgi:hypothetical protein
MEIFRCLGVNLSVETRGFGKSTAVAGILKFGRACLGFWDGSVGWGVGIGGRWRLRFFHGIFGRRRVEGLWILLVGVHGGGLVGEFLELGVVGFGVW